MRRTVALVVALAVPSISFSSDRAAAASGVSATLYRLASNNGAFERSGAPQWILDVADGRVLPVTGEPGLESGARVMLPVAGTKKGPVSASTLRRASLLSAPLPGGKLVPNRRLAIVPLQWGGSTWGETDSRNTQDILAVLVPWWKKMSAGLETLNPSVAPVLDGNSSFSADQGCRSTGSMLSAAEKHLEQTGLGSEFDNVMVLFPAAAPLCQWAGLGSLGGGVTWTYARASYGKVWAHELGHNLGFTHGNVCVSPVALTYVRPCIDDEYGDSMDIMGSYYSQDMDAAYFAPAFLRTAKWLPDNKMAVWSGAAVTYTLQRADRTDLGITAVNLPAVDQANGDNTFWLQYNPRPSYVSKAPPSGKNGGVVLTMSPSEQFARTRFISPETGKASGFASARSYLCDLAASDDLSPGIHEPRILPGMSFTDPRNRFTVTVLSADGTSAEVRVEPVAAPTVAPPAEVVAVADPDGARRISVSVKGQTPGRNEPVTYSVDTLEDPGKTCTFDAFGPGCVLSGLTRNVLYTVRVVGVNGPARASPVLAPTVTLASVPPAFDVRLTPLSSSIVAKVTVDDGGSPPTTALTLELPGKPVCELSVATETECRFDGLNPRSSYVLTARGANSIGPRTVEYTARTAVAEPVSPTVTAKFDGPDLMVTATAAAVDATNVTHFNFFCVVGEGSFDTDPIPMDPVTLSAVARVTAARGKAVRCWVTAVASDGGDNGGYETSNATIIGVTEKGRVYSSRLVLKVSVKSTKKGTVVVKWSTSGNASPPYVNVRTSRNKWCARLTARSCVVRGLKSRSKFTVVVSASDGLSSDSKKSTVRVK